MTSADYEPYIEAALRQLIAARKPADKVAACDQFTALVRARNAARTSQEVARLERARDLA